MSKSKQRVCKFPKCHKEVSGDKSLFCLEHDRTKNEIIRQGITVGTGLLVAASAGLLTKMKNKK